MTTKRYYWIKLPKDFFRQREIKKLRKIAGGDTFTIIYLKILLLTADKSGIVEYGNHQDFIEELSLDIDEEEENVKVTVAFMLANGLMEDLGENKKAIPQALELTGSESFSASRVRKHRAAKNTEVLQCNTDVTEKRYNVTIEEEIEKEIEIELELEEDEEAEDGQPRQSLITFFENNIHPLVAYEYKKLKELLIDCGEDSVCYALHEAVENNARSMRYITAVALADKEKASKRYKDQANGKNKQSCIDPFEAAMIAGGKKNADKGANS